MTSVVENAGYFEPGILGMRLFPAQMDLTGIAVRSSTSPTSFCRKGSP